MATGLSELKREAIKMLYKKNILTEKEYLACKNLLLQMNSSPTIKTAKESKVICNIESESVLEASLASKEKAIAFPFILKNSTQKSAVVEQIRVDFRNKKGKLFKYSHSYYLTRTGQVAETLVLKSEEEVLLGPIAKYSDFDNLIEGLRCEVSYIDVSNWEEVHCIYETAYGYMWRHVETVVVPFYCIYRHTDLSEHLYDAVELYGKIDEEKTFDVGNVSITESSSIGDEKKSFVLRGELHWEPFVGFATCKLKVIFYDFEEQIVNVITKEIEIAGGDGFDVFEIHLSEEDESFWQGIKIIRIGNSIITKRMLSANLKTGEDKTDASISKITSFVKENQETQIYNDEQCVDKIIKFITEEMIDDEN